MSQPPSKSPRFAPWFLLYALLVVYSSTVIGPMGLNYVPMDTNAALKELLARLSLFADNGSDQRADWMGNLSMFAIFGFLLAGTLWPKRGGFLGFVAAIVSVGFGLAFVLAVKYAQLFFPPRTVTLNYVVAQSSGLLLGIVLFAKTRRPLMNLWSAATGNDLRNLRSLLTIYSVALFVFYLMPLDFALDAADLKTRLDLLPRLLLSFPGEGRPMAIRAAVSIAGALSIVPLGMLAMLPPEGKTRSVTGAFARGSVVLIVLHGLTALLISGIPALPTLLTRIVGLSVGIGAIGLWRRSDPNRALVWLRRLVLLAWIPYLIALIAVNGLISSQWRSVGETLANFYWRGLLPLFYYYIVAKADAARSIAAHAAMYAPIGIFIGIRGGRPIWAIAIALVLAVGIEAAHYLRPGLEGDINTVFIAGGIAWVAARMTPAFWRMLTAASGGGSVGPSSSAPAGWREKAAARLLREQAQAAAAKSDAEQF